ncbi:MULTISPECIES: HigA family addiction module antitoxin [Glaesserella]|uniref:Addiction module antidote protein, HigA family n=1 Tax=Glaesserella australis TaxID=2094024 RepID=A0A328C165_9PAST|nr:MULTISPECIES: HigA family addiction module antitoxin [Glaesserella]AUI65682.1 addiction module antidote protein, HigA family [Glaesserella sp. 15-184]RAL19032.1 addiction module antidote protein, HigA family [Glaesserella australis]
MKTTPRKPTSVGEILQEEFLSPLNLKITDLATILDVHRNTASAIVNNSTRITLEMAFKLAKAFSTTPEFWLNLQNNVDLWELNHNTTFQQSLAKVKVVSEWSDSTLGVPALG